MLMSTINFNHTFHEIHNPSTIHFINLYQNLILNTTKQGLNLFVEDLKRSIIIYFKRFSNIWMLVFI